jgi:hypothetical protein
MCDIFCADYFDLAANFYEIRMRVAGWSPIRSCFENCILGRAPCSGPQMRNGFIALNFIAWAIILASFELLT